MTVEANTRQITGIVVSHTHWDREWYLSFQRFRMMLVDTIDAVLELLDNDPGFAYFTLDGQTVVLEDYLEIRPENADRLARHIRSGKLLVGPWYVLPDEFLVTAESLVRNLIIGRQAARRFGSTMPVGYLPDTFGHPAQMPQMLRRWGIDNAVLFRGVTPPAAEFMWEAPDGSQVLTIFMPGGYCNAAGLAANPDRFLQARLNDLVDQLRAMATTSNILLMNGCDHFPPRRDLSRFVDAGNGQLEDVALHQGTLPQYIERVKAEQPDLRVVKGEFRKPRPGRVTPGVLSARMYLKQQNFEVSNLLERYAEPLSALVWLTNGQHPDSYLNYAWRQVLQNQPHDSICGCSIDAVHRDMLVRFHYAKDVAGELVRRALADLPRAVWPGLTEDASYFLVFNPVARPRRDCTKLTLHFIERGADFHLLTMGGKVVPHQVVARKDAAIEYRTCARSIEVEGRQMTAAPVIDGESLATLVREGLWQKWEGEEVDVLVATGLPAAGFNTLRVAKGAAEAGEASDLRAGQDWIENSLLRLEVDSHGRISVLDWRSGIRHGPLNVFEDGGDRGDEYSYCPPDTDAVVTSALGPAAVRLVESGHLRASIEIVFSLRVPRRIASDRRSRDDRSVELPITTRVSLNAASPRVEFVTEVENQAEDHRLRVLFTSPIATGWSHAHGQFEVTSRPLEMDASEVGRVPGPDEEVAVTTFPQATFVDINDREHGLAVLNKGLPEYEAIRSAGGTTVALTLLRCVGWLSRPDLSARHGNAGPSLPTPDAQCPGRHVFEYAVVPHAGDWATAAIPDEAAQFTAPALSSSFAARALHNGTDSPAPRLSLSPSFSAVHVEPREVLVSAIKKAESSSAVVLRLFNIGGHTVQARAAFGWPVAQAREVALSEDEIDAPSLAVDSAGAVTFALGPHEIKTLLLIAR